MTASKRLQRLEGLLPLRPVGQPVTADLSRLTDAELDELEAFSRRVHRAPDRAAALMRFTPYERMRLADLRDRVTA